MHILEKLRAHGYGEMAESLRKQGRESIRMRTGPASECNFRPGESKIGGDAHVPRDFVWPEFAGVPLFFIAQIDMTQLPRCQAATLLPERGLLSFFSDGGRTGGHSPSDRGAARVFYFDCEAARLVRIARYDREDEDLESISPRRVEFSATMDYPFHNLQTDFNILTCPPSDKNWDTFLALWVAHTVEGRTSGADEQVHTKLLGWPDLYHGDVFNQAQLATNGLIYGDINNPGDPRAGILAAKRHDWQLLLQIYCEEGGEDNGLTIGDAVRILYFMITKDDLASRNFDDIWFAYQCG